MPRALEHTHLLLLLLLLGRVCCLRLLSERADEYLDAIARQALVTQVALAYRDRCRSTLTTCDDGRDFEEQLRRSPEERMRRIEDLQHALLELASAGRAQTR